MQQLLVWLPLIVMIAGLFIWGFAQAGSKLYQLGQMMAQNGMMVLLFQVGTTIGKKF